MALEMARQLRAHVAVENPSSVPSTPQSVHTCPEPQEAQQPLLAAALMYIHSHVDTHMHIITVNLSKRQWADLERWLSS